MVVVGGWLNLHLDHFTFENALAQFRSVVFLYHCWCFLVHFHLFLWRTYSNIQIYRPENDSCKIYLCLLMPACSLSELLQTQRTVEFSNWRPTSYWKTGEKIPDPQHQHDRREKVSNVWVVFFHVDIRSGRQCLEDGNQPGNQKSLVVSKSWVGVFFFFWLRLAVKNTSRFSNFLWTLRQTSGTGQSKSPVTGPAWSSRISGADERQWLTQFLKPRWPPTVQDFKINVSVKYLYSIYLLNYWSIDTTKMSGKSTKHCKLCFQSRITKKKNNPAM